MKIKLSEMFEEVPWQLKLLWLGGVLAGMSTFVLVIYILVKVAQHL